MKFLDEIARRLEGDEVLLAALLASDTRSMWRRLVRCVAVRELARELSSDIHRIEMLCSYLVRLLVESYDRRYRHPQEAAICAGLTLLARSPLGCARRHFAQCKRLREPSLALVQRMAEYCDEQFVDSSCLEYAGNPLGSSTQHYAEGRRVVLLSEADDTVTSGELVGT